MRKSLTFALAALSLAGCGSTEGDTQSSQPLVPYNSVAQQVSSRPILLEKLPLDVHRRAVQLLEDVRGTESAPTWKDAVLGPEAMPLYRPDVLGVAYYEFRVLAGGKEPVGYIIASTGDHDYPIAHWNFEGLSLTEELARKAEGREVAAFYKLDSLSYAAEGTKGELLATLGQLPPRVVGQDPAWLDKPVEPTDATWVPDLQVEDDSKAGDVKGSLVIKGPTKAAPIELAKWSSWDELKAGYTESFATLAESLRRQAAEEWETEALVLKSGEGLVMKKPHELALLYPDVTIDLYGEGADLVRAEQVETTPGQKVLVLTAVGATAGKELPLQVQLKYGNGQGETLSFVVLSPEDVGTQVSGASAPGGSEVHWTQVGPMGPWSSWYTFYAGTHSDQRLYNQMSAGSSPNTSSCYSGCGGTAWAMLFGWGDYQAAVGNPSWWHRTGLYRQNGGYGADAVAPTYMDTGVRNMTWEIRNRIGTFCISGSGATFPWDMGQASGYLVNRTGASLSTHYNVVGIHEARLRDKARDSIVNRKVPAIIGTGWLQHYPLAYGYRWRSRTVRKCFIFCWNETEYQREFYVNQGWGGGGNGWVSAGTWFAGQLYAN